MRESWLNAKAMKKVACDVKVKSRPMVQRPRDAKEVPLRQDKMAAIILSFVQRQENCHFSTIVLPQPIQCYCVINDFFLESFVNHLMKRKLFF